MVYHFFRNIRKVIKPLQDVYKLYIVHYNSVGNNRDHHALFIEYPSIENKGLILQVMEDKYNAMQFDMRERCLTHSSNFSHKDLIGTIYDKNIVVDICQQILPPNPTIRNEDGSHKDCQDWVNEILYIIIEKGLLSF